MSAPDPARDLFRHTVATLAYRGGKALRGAPEGFSGFRAGDGSRSAGETLAHIGDLVDWALSQADGDRTFREVPPTTWEAGEARFLAALGRLMRGSRPTRRWRFRPKNSSRARSPTL